MALRENDQIRMETMEITEEECKDFLMSAPWHVRSWVEGLQASLGQEYPKEPDDMSSNELSYNNNVAYNNNTTFNSEMTYTNDLAQNDDITYNNDPLSNDIAQSNDIGQNNDMYVNNISHNNDLAQNNDMTCNNNMPYAGDMAQNNDLAYTNDVAQTNDLPYSNDLVQNDDIAQNIDASYTNELAQNNEIVQTIEVSYTNDLAENNDIAQNIDVSYNNDISHNDLSHNNEMPYSNENIAYNNNNEDVTNNEKFLDIPESLLSENMISPASGESSTSNVDSKNEEDNDKEFDNEFDDESDIYPVEVIVLTDKDVTETEELDEPVRDLLSKIEKGMDDEADSLLGESSVFKWEDGFGTFRGYPEEFKGPTPGPIKDYDLPYDAFIDIWDRGVVERIAIETNRYAIQTINSLRKGGVLHPSSPLHEWSDTNADEILMFFGVLMYMAIDPRTSQREYWRTDNHLEMPEFRRLMPFSRFCLLSKFLHFVDNSDDNRNPLRSEGASKQTSLKLFKLSPIIEHLGNKFNSLYNVGRNIYIDESLTLFKGRLSWVQSIRPARFGIKSYEICEADTGYMAKFQICTSDGSNDQFGELGSKITKVILELLGGLENRGHCVTMDNFYNSPSLARYLKVLGFDSLGTLGPHRRHVPADIIKVPKGSVVSRQCGDVSVISWKDSKLLTVMSTYHTNTTFIETKEGKSFIKPVCVRDFNNTMAGVCLKDQLLSMYSLQRKRGMKWYMKMFKRLLNVSVHNAFVMFVKSLKRRNILTVTHREFRYDLAKTLVERHFPGKPTLSDPVGQYMRLRQDVVHVPRYDVGRNARKRCVICLRLKKDKLVHSQCITCGVFMCFENCWSQWHSYKNLEGQDIRRAGNKRKRDDE